MNKNLSLHNIFYSIWVTLLTGILFTSTAHAASLQEAKAQGLLGEQPNGYLGLVKGSAPSDVKSLMNEINAKRRQAYIGIAQRNKTSLDVVEKLAGKKAIERTPSGQYVLLPSGQWVRK
jgi:uncharacterized protein YdbL (DUF1318 family)